ncbi:putative DNA ligase [Klebsiella phage vB_KpnP_NahiliMali]|uniref:DNA ligase n=1 Tax=Klebsiella phage vB_KpnP_NahiliMali TaxID=2591373 RepID=A0A5B9NGJ7_9CAUD|nr:putative DNA ligase [Klebsiella phage vB_KpnP_NahiliMali]
MINFKTKPHRAVSYVESSILKAAEAAGSLIAEIKYDGFRGNLVIDNRNEDYWTEFCTREGTEVPALAYLAGEHSDRWGKLIRDDENPFKQGVMVDGELMVKGVNFQTGSGILRTKWLKMDNAKFHVGDYERNEKNCRPKPKQPFCLNPAKLTVIVYDLIPLDVVKSGSDYEIPTVIRVEHAKLFVKLLRKHFPEIDWQSPESWDVYDIESLQALYEEQRAKGHEGLIVKDPFAPYRRGKKTGMWKMKPENEIDGEIVGLVWGTEGKANEGKVIGFEVLLENGVVVNACGITKAQMGEFTEKYLHDNQMRSEGEAVNPYSGWQCQVVFMEETPDGSLRHPSFHSFRGTEDNPTLKV